MEKELILSRNWGLPESHTLRVYLERGGYQGLKKALSMKPDEVIQEVKQSGLRGRGGAGFPAGMKWGFVPKESRLPRYLICNADEGEPGTFKDRYIMELDPHMMIEGIAIASYAIGAHVAYIYVRGEYVFPAQRVETAIREAREAGFLGKNILGSGFDLDVFVHLGAGAYICGEETALIESLEGKRGYPRLKPPFPAVVGLFAGPTVINNVETLASVPYIILQGASAYRRFGTEKSPGTKLFSVSGHVAKPGVYEVPLGIPFASLLEMCGGMRNGSEIKAVIPGGSSVPVLTGEEAMRTNLDYESLADAGSMLGSGGVIVMDSTTCMVRALSILARFYHHESCGQCTPCREGTGWISRVVGRIENGEMRDGDIDLLCDVAGGMMGKTVCPLADACAMPVLSFVKKFREEFLEHGRKRGCPMGNAHA